MPIDAQVDPGGFLRVTIVGAWPSAAEQVDVRAALVRDGLLDLRSLDTPVLIDMRQVTRQPTANDIRGAVMTAIQQQAVKIRRAMLVGTPDQHEVARRIQQLGAYEGAEVGVFTDERDAIAWLAPKH